MKLINISDRFYVNPDVVQYVYIRPNTLEGTYFYGVYVKTGTHPEIAVTEKLSLSDAETLLQQTIAKLTAKEN